jgi:hypothetical protein
MISEQVHGTIMQTEQEFRRVNCLKCLQTLRSLAMQHAHFTIAKGKHAKGIKAVTQADAQAQRLQTKIEQVRWEYPHSRARLRDLGMMPQDIKTFQPFRTNDVRELKQMALKHESLGSGRLVLPWYWRVSLAEEGSADSLQASSTDVAAEYEQSKSDLSLPCFLSKSTFSIPLGIRVQWFRARERYARWQEEVEWLQREAASTVLDFAHRRDIWLSKADTSELPGWAAFCHRQSAVWETMLRAAHGKLHTLLQV